MIWPSPLVVAPPPLFVVGCRVLSVAPPCCRAPAGSVLLPVRSSVGFDAGRCSDRSVVAGRFWLPVARRVVAAGLVLLVVSWLASGVLSISWWSVVELRVRVLVVSIVGQPPRARSSLQLTGCLSPPSTLVVFRRLWLLVVDPCRWSLFIAPHSLSPAALTQGSIHYHILDSLRFVRFPSPPLSPACFLAPARIVRYATIH